MRKLILHYHLFKNAGSSIDEILKRSFGDSWLTFDRDSASAKILPTEMAAVIEEHPRAIAISSHQVLPPLPRGDFEVFPIVFLRHPIDRARSAYLFEWKTQMGLAEPKGRFSDYVREKLDPKNHGPITNYHVYQFANIAYAGDKPKYNSVPSEKLEKAKEFLLALPFFGLVECFQESLERLHFYLKYHFPDLQVVNRHVNTTQDSTVAMDEKLLNIRRELGEALYGELLDRNKLDLDLYKFARAHFNHVVPREI